MIARCICDDKRFRTSFLQVWPRVTDAQPIPDSDPVGPVTEQRMIGAAVHAETDFAGEHSAQGLHHDSRPKSAADDIDLLGAPDGAALRGRRNHKPKESKTG